MKYSTLKQFVEDSTTYLESCEAVQILEYALEHFDGDEDYISQEDFLDAISEEIDSFFTYYRDAWDYLENSNITDFSDAVLDWGVYDICAIASYYAEQECRSYVDDNWDDAELFEDDEEDEEDEEDENEED